MNDLRAALCAGLLLGQIAQAEPIAPSPQLHLGYYQEDAVSDSADPLTGILALRWHGQRLSGALLYALHGCRPGADEARIAAALAGAALGGSWHGSIDGHDTGGSFQGLIGENGQLHGSYTSARGLTGVDCNHDGRQEYAIAPLGRWWSWPLGGGDLTLHPVAGGLAWPDLGGRYSLRLLDARCLDRGDGLADCLRLDDDQAVPQFSLAAAAAVLERDKDYVLVVLALEEFSGSVLGFGSKRFRY